MEMDVSRREAGSGIRWTAIRFLLVALACAEWVAVCIVVYRSAFGI
jgi:hypothetical protein